MTIKANPDCAEAFKQIVTMKVFQQADPFVQRMEAMAADPKISRKNKMLLNFALGKVYEDQKHYSVAFSCLETGNRIKRSEFKYNPLSDKKAIECIKFIFNQKYLKKHANDCIKDHTPIFILGMPRSGTSLVEQILANHPDVFGAGELKIGRASCRERV